MRGDRGPERGSYFEGDDPPERVNPRENTEKEPAEFPTEIVLSPEVKKLRDEIQELLRNPEEQLENIKLSPEIKLLRDEIQDLLNQENPELQPIRVPEKKSLSDRIADELRKTRENMMDKFNRAAAALLNEAPPPPPNNAKNERPKPREMKQKNLDSREIIASRSPRSPIMKIEKINTSKNKMEKVDNKPKMSKEELKEKMKVLKKLVDSYEEKLKNSEKSKLSDNKNAKNSDEFKTENVKNNKTSNVIKEKDGMKVGEEKNEQKNKEVNKEKEKIDQNINKEINSSEKKRPPGFWKKWENLEVELKKEINKEYKNNKGEVIKKEGEFPTQEQLREMKCYSIANAISKYHGGYLEVRKKMGLESDRKPPGYWKKWENVKNELNEITKKEYKNKKGEIIKKAGDFPSNEQLRKINQKSLVKAIHKYHGGYLEVRKKMGFESDKRPPDYWKKWENLKSELNDVINNEFKNKKGKVIKKVGEFPTPQQLRKINRQDIEHAIHRYHGGFFEVRKKMGLESDRKPLGYWKKWGNIKKDLSEIIKNEYKNDKGGIIKKAGEYPTQSELLELKQESLLQAIYQYHGGFQDVRTKMGFESDRKPPGYWQNPINFFKEINEAIKINKNKFPNYNELKEMERYSIVDAAKKYYGGLNNVRQVMGYPAIDWSEKMGYISRRGYATEQAVIELMKEWMDLNGYPYSDKKQTKVAPGKQLECVCEHGKTVGIDVTNSKYPSSVESKWKEKEYQKHVDQLWVVVVSNRFNEKQYKKWNEESPSNVVVIDYKNLGKFLNNMNSGDVKFNIPPEKKAQLDALAKCTYENRERLKREYETLKKQKKIEDFL